MAKADFIKGAIKHPGAFRAQANEHGESTAEFAADVKSNPNDYDTTTRRRAALANTLAKLRQH